MGSQDVDWGELLNRHKNPPRQEEDNTEPAGQQQAGADDETTAPAELANPPMPDNTYDQPLAPELPLQPYTELHAAPYLTGYWVTVDPPDQHQEQAANQHAIATATGSTNPTPGLPPCTEAYLYQDDIDPQVWTMHIHESPSREQLLHI